MMERAFDYGGDQWAFKAGMARQQRSTVVAVGFSGSESDIHSSVAAMVMATLMATATSKTMATATTMAMKTVTATEMVTTTEMEMDGDGGNKGNGNGYGDSNGNGNNDSNTSCWRSKKSAQLHTQLQQQINYNELIRTEYAERVDINHLARVETTWRMGGAKRTSIQVPNGSRYLIFLPNWGSCQLIAESVLAAHTTIKHASLPHTGIHSTTE
jgi:hypothetical protein